MDKGVDITLLGRVLAWYAALCERPRELAAIAGDAALSADDLTLAKLAGALERAARRARLAPDHARADAALDWAANDGRCILTLADVAYPPLLAEIASPPLVLFVDGAQPDILRQPQLAIVGSRRATRGALEFADGLAADCAHGGIHVTSGMALGIDAAAHRGALNAAGSTVAVLGCGIDRVYPQQHRELAMAIRAQGCVVSEFPLGTPPRRQNFPRRNRIIAGLSLGTLVIEAAARSGSISTAMHALENGREVFAVPGSVRNPLSEGCHWLIRNGAALLRSFADVLDDVPALRERASPGVPSGVSPGVSPDQPAQPRRTDTMRLSMGERQLLDACAWGPVTVDQLSQRSGLTVSEVCSMLLTLELAGAVESRANGTYLRIR